MISEPDTSIPAFYAGQSIFLTGATGFLGKVFIEKILRSCPDVREIFLLMRPKKNLNIHNRLKDLLNLSLYDKLRDEYPLSFNKLIPICGDVKEKMLGLSIEDREMLLARVTLIIHGAASVKFNDTLKYAILVNTRATRDVCILAQSMKNLKALVYISTAFAHVNNHVIEEKTYAPVADWQKTIAIAESLDEDALNIFTLKYLNHVPNTYIFSKNLAEGVIQDYSSSLPCAIVRPSMVFPALKEPIPGWIDNLYGPIGLSIGVAKGLIRLIHCNKNVFQHIVPIDIVVNTVIAVLWKIGLNTSTSTSSVYVCNCTAIKLSYVTIRNMFDNVIYDVPFERTVLIPGTLYVGSFALFYVLTILLHILPSILMDSVLYLFGRRPLLLKLMRTLYAANCALSYFSLYNWIMDNRNMLSLMSSVSSDNQDFYSMNTSLINVEEYLKICIIGVKMFLFQEDLNRLGAAKTHLKRMYVIVIITKIFFFIGLLWTLYKWMYLI